MMLWRRKLINGVFSIRTVNSINHLSSIANNHLYITLDSARKKSY